MNEIIITIDVDWAPDKIISQVVHSLLEYKIKSTWFVTHNSLEIQKMKKHSDLFELGLHPNFTKRSTQGENPRAVMEYLLKIVPKAKSIRNHGLVQSSKLLELVGEKFNIHYDVSLFVPHTKNLVPHKIFFSKNKSLLRFPYFWEDDEELNRPNPIFDIKHPSYHQPGLKIFNFHPIHIFLNSQRMGNYEKMKKETNYPTVSLNNLELYIHKGIGVGTFFNEILEYLSKNKLKGRTISELSYKFK